MRSVTGDRVMPTQQTPAVHIFCLCGQKMRVSEDMYGRRARCVACGLKIRIPRFEEIPEGTTEIYLKEHPEFIREKHIPQKEAGPENKVKKRRRKRISVPLDPLDPLQKFCSLSKKIKTELHKDNGRSRAELETYSARLKELRAAFDDELHQRLMEAAIELTAAQEKLAELTLSARVGEVNYESYREQANRLRWRRECLEKRQVNLRAWLAVRDPDLAGGYIELSLHRLNEIPLRVPLAEDTVEPPVLLGWMIDQLRAAFADRQRAEQKLDTINHMREQQELPEKEGKHAAKEQKALRARAMAAVRFWQERLEHFKKDIEADQRVVNAQLDLARGRRQLGELGHEQLDALERDLRRAKADLEKARHTVERAVFASSDRDLPVLRGTFLKRLGKPSPPRHRSSVVFAILGLLFMVAIAAAVILGIVSGVIPLPPFTGRPTPPASTQGAVEQTVPPAPAEAVKDVAQAATQEESTPREEAAPPEPEDPASEESEAPPLPSPDETTAEQPPAEEPRAPERLEEPPVTLDDEGPPAVSPQEATEEETVTHETMPVVENSIEVELRGVVTIADKAPRFSLRLHTPDGKSRERVRELGDSVAEGWIIREYNPDQQSITLFNGEDLLIVRRGEKEPLPVSTPEEP